MNWHPKKSKTYHKDYKTVCLYEILSKPTIVTFMLPCCIIIGFCLNNQPDALIIQIYSVMKLLNVLGIFSAHHQEFSTVHSELVSFMQVLMTASKQSHDGTPDS
jgi:hypothetical protein